ncbi:HAD family hydrolase [Paenibacillus sp. HN-1]|uniref:HAD family hydrolase n=1 Tax=Paenibacillus TaxID=44249 RepID=UPI001CA998C2|nr:MULTISPECIES: HAD family hydrolase [Paenibacillus]MBY9082005.1 HAD family hydrolase [Paenibacillus sp. CGMCC 1.18879]MBY9085837.1 HAD family hydrolase [Paenibacillus sinensis]
MGTAKALLFDLDNTLMDRDATFRSFGTQFISHYFGHMNLEEQLALVEDMIVRDADGYRDKDGFFRELSEVLPWKEPVAAEEIRGFYDIHYAGHGALMKDAVECLDYLKGRSYPLGLVTNGKSDIQRGKIELLKLEGYFNTIVISGEAGITKPDEAIYRLALEKLGYAADETLFIGDHPVNDIWGAGRTGMQGIWLRRNHPWDEKLDVRPWRTIDELCELKEIL